MSTKRALQSHKAASPGAKSMKSALPVVAVVSLPDHPALADMPHDAAEFIVGDSVEALGPRLAAAEALMWVPGSPPALLTTLWEGGHVPKARWVHSFFAGVDALGPFMRGPLASRPDVSLTNGRGAFSSSLRRTLEGTSAASTRGYHRSTAPLHRGYLRVIITGGVWSYKRLGEAFPNKYVLCVAA